MESILIRPIQAADDPFLAEIIRHSLAEFGANRPGTVFFDASTDHLSDLFQEKRSIYYVTELDNNILGGAGIFPSNGLPAGTCELVKMYLKKEARGRGIGLQLINKCLEYAAMAGYNAVYLESMPELKRAIDIYKKIGFDFLEAPLGNTGHFGCDVWMLKKI